MREGDVRERTFAMPLTMMTSAANVIGEEIARTFVREGAKIAIVDLLGPFQRRLAAQRPLRHGVARARRPLAGCEPQLVHAVTPCPFCAS
jgi:NAD(P)-dependent dehydrogenase (short-subunit alcohol dehydrogenase family)